MRALAAAAASVVDIAHVLRTASAGQYAIACLAGATAASGLIYYCPPGQLAALLACGLLPAALPMFD